MVRALIEIKLFKGCTWLREKEKFTWEFKEKQLLIAGLYSSPLLCLKELRRWPLGSHTSACRHRLLWHGDVVISVAVQMSTNMGALQEQQTRSAASNISSVAEYSRRFLTAFFSFLLLDAVLLVAEQGRTWDRSVLSSPGEESPVEMTTSWWWDCRSRINQHCFGSNFLPGGQATCTESAWCRLCA